MRKIVLIPLVVLAMTVSLFAQKNNLNTAYSALNLKELDRAKAAIDAASVHEETKNMTKTWLYRGKIYLKIDDDKDKYKNLDPDSKEKAFEAFLTCLKLDKDKVYEKEVIPDFMASAARLSNKGMQAIANKEYDKAVRYFYLLNQAFEFDKDNGLAQRNITKDGITYNLYLAALQTKDYATAEANLQKLIDNGYKDPNIYIDMSQLFLLKRDTIKGLSYLEKGRMVFDDNVNLINAELAIYIAQRKTDALLEKTNKAIEINPDNEILHFIVGSVYDKKKEMEKAEAAYKKAIEIRPDYGDANYNLGVMYYAKGVDWNNKANALPPDQTAKFKDYESKRDTEFKKAIPYLEKAVEAFPTDKSTIQALKKMYVSTGDTEKYNQLKEKEKK
ncbi:MAG: tetratricopeptide repeat protein [Bacteroidetes bacterium]|nr:tetratricopeptide repeat protein [Bacteroidota bacterium]